MKCGARVALGVAGGYFLGRTRKMKLALMLGGMAAGRRAGGPGELLNQGSKLLSSSPELTRLADDVRGRLLESGKSAALAVATRQVESLTDRVGRGVESLGGVGVPQPRISEEVADEDTDTEQEQEAPADEGTGGGDAGDAAGEKGAAPRRPARSRAQSSARGDGGGGRSGAAARRTASGTGGTGGTGKAARSAGESAGGRRKTGGTTRRQRGEGDG